MSIGKFNVTSHQVSNEIYMTRPPRISGWLFVEHYVSINTTIRCILFFEVNTAASDTFKTTNNTCPAAQQVLSQQHYEGRARLAMYVSDISCFFRSFFLLSTLPTATLEYLV